MRRLPAIVLLVLTLGCVGYPQVVRALCGDGMLEPDFELCDDGVANGANACCTTQCDFIDGDRDGICDAHDPCVASAPILTDVALVMKGFATPAADDTFRLTGALAPSAPLDPARDGFSVVLGNRFFGSFAHAAFPAGTGWRPRPRGGWSYRDAAGTIGGITSVVIKGRGDGTFLFRIQGRRRDYARLTDIRPIRAMVALAAADASAEQCGETTLAVSRCTFSNAGNTLRCLPPPPQRRCPSDPSDAVPCDARNAAAAQETYLVGHGRYFSGRCEDLPTFTLSPQVVCATVSTETEYTVVTTSPTASIACVYSSIPRPGDPNLVCHD